jgi:hypothetical protein
LVGADSLELDEVDQIDGVANAVPDIPESSEGALDAPSAPTVAMDSDSSFSTSLTMVIHHKEFKRLWADVPTIRWDRPWQIVYDQIREAVGRPQFTIGNPFRPQLPRPSSIPLTVPEFFVHGLERRDSLQTAVDRAEQRVEDLEAEVGRLRRHATLWSGRRAWAGVWSCWRSSRLSGSSCRFG